MAAVKICISIRPETISQMEYLARELFSLRAEVPRSQLIQWIIADSYYKCQNKDKK